MKISIILMTGLLAINLHTDMIGSKYLLVELTQTGTKSITQKIILILNKLEIKN